MKQYKVLRANKGYMVYGLERAMEYAQKDSQVAFRVSVFDGNQKIATFEWGKQIA